MSGHAAEVDACVCPTDLCLGVPGESDACGACLALDLEESCLHDPVAIDDEDEPCGCDVTHPRWCAWNGACCDNCTHDTTHEARVTPPADGREVQP